MTDPPKIIRVEECNADGKILSDFVTKNSVLPFQKLEMSSEFLKHKPEKWASNTSYIDVQQCIHKIKVVNDAAERGISKILNFKSILGLNEDQKQLMLQVVE